MYVHKWSGHRGRQRGHVLPDNDKNTTKAQSSHERPLKNSAIGSLGLMCAADSLELVIVHFPCSQQT